MADKRDYKKEYRDLYQPGKRPSLLIFRVKVTV